ncbi:MAG: Ni/Fe hydrogenase subunit alpha [Candidatus Bathyarchaeia archaeon]
MSLEKTVNVEYIPRVEGQGDLKIKVKGETAEVEFVVYEPPRFFEAFLTGRNFIEIHELTSRICGICPVSHQLAALKAVEKAMGVEVSDLTLSLRKLLHMGSHIQSHILNLYLLSAPDYLGYESIIPMAKDNLEIVKRALRLKKLGNDLVELVGGRAIHPVSTVVGGFTETPSKTALDSIKKRLMEAREDAIETVRFVSKFSYPDFERRCEHIALTKEGEYAINDGKLRSTEGLEIREEEYRACIKEEQVDYSWAKHSTVVGRGSYLVGPLARVNLSFNSMTELAKSLADEVGFKTPCYNPFKSLVARALEVLNLVDMSVEAIDNLNLKDERISERDFKPREGEGYAIVEAPRGILYHAYGFNGEGRVKWADIVTPTCQNAKNIEEDLKAFTPKISKMAAEDIALRSEMLVRAYDPCISCSVHAQLLS